MAKLAHNMEKSTRVHGQYVAYDKKGYACRVKKGGIGWEAYSKEGRYIGTRKTLALIAILVGSSSIL